MSSLRNGTPRAGPPSLCPAVSCRTRMGIWRRSKRARSRRPERGQRVQQRRRAYMSWNGAAGSTSLDESMNRALPLGDRQAVAPPFRIECPECGFVSMVSWEGFDLLSTE